jgi:diguanylate cyclase (GGDEF)-like protein
MYRILVFTNDDDFSERLQLAAVQRGDLELTMVGDVDAALGELSAREVSAILVDESAASLDGERRAQLLSAGGRALAVFAAGSIDFDELTERAHLGEMHDAAQILERLDQALSASSSSMDERPESGIYFASDTQGRSYLNKGGGLNRNTSYVEVDNDWAPHILYVGADDEFRQSFEQTTHDRGAELITFDEPCTVTVRAGAAPIDLAVLSVEAGLSATRRLVRFLRRRQPEAPFEVLLVASSESPLPEGLGRTLGADEVLVHPVDPVQLVERASLRPSGDRGDMLVVCRHIRRAEMFESALSREPVDVTFVSGVERLQERFAAKSPDIVLLDEASGSLDVEAVVEQLRSDNPFASTRYLAIFDSRSEQQTSARLAFDGVLYAPVLAADIRQLVRLHLTHASLGRAALERDRLTDVNSALGLGDDLQELLDSGTQSGRSVALTGVDVDGLGEINSRYGEPVGDSVLRSLADALHLAAGDRAAIYRTDGDEFFILQHTDESRWPAMRDRIDRALHVFRQQTFRSVDGRGTYATASAGSILVPPSAVSAEVCLQKCWLVLERAAATSQDRVLVAQIDPSVLSEVESSHDLTKERS